MDKKDMKLISYLRTNSRMSLSNLSRKTTIPVSTIFNRIKSNSDDRILKHTVILNFSKLGYSTKAIMLLRIKSNHKINFEEYVKHHKNVNSVSKILGDYDFIVEGIFKEICDYNDFTEELNEKFKIDSVKSFFIVNDLKKESFMSEPNLIDIY